MPDGNASRPTSTTIGGLLEELAGRHGHRPAIIHRERTLTYADLWSETVETAKTLLALGVARGDRVGILLGNRPEWLVTCFGAAAIGATVVPLNTWHKQQELAWTIRHSGLSVLVSATRFLKHDYEETFRTLIPELDRHEPGALSTPGLPALRALAFAGASQRGPRWTDVLRAAGGVSDERFRAAAAQVTPEDILFLLYTSGSTAEPKGVLLQHGSLIVNGFDTGARRLITEQDIVWLGAPLFYGMGAANAMPATLTHGAALVLQDHFDAGEAIDLMHSTRATVYYGAGAGNMSQAILDHQSFSREKLATLERGNAGMTAEYKRMTIVEMGIHGATGAYGLTEVYGHATGHHPDDPLEVKLHTNGTALPGFEIAIADPETDQRLPAGASGLVLLRGHITPGYFGNAEETARVLRPDGWFDTGDIGHLDEAGRLVFQTRLKGVIKSGGINVSPLEIEQLLAQHPDIRSAHVVGIPHPTRGEVPVAFIEGHGRLAEDDVKDFVRERAASFKVPHHVLFRSSLPRLASGKVARQTLIEEAVRDLETRQPPD